MTGKRIFRAAAVQMNSGAEVAANLKRADALLARAADGGAQVAALPEFFPLLAADESLKLAAAEKDGDGPIQNFLSDSARRHKMHIIGGAMPIAAPGGRVYGACLVYGRDGGRAARYDKRRLFRYDGARESYDEGRTLAAGAAAVTFPLPMCRAGAVVCFDLRFPALFAEMAVQDGAPPEVVFAPSAFTRPTGRAHWELLLRARAIDNLCYIIAPAQCGEHPGGRKTHGHTMAVNAWGEVVARAGREGEEVVFADVDLEMVAECRRRLPLFEAGKN